MPCEELCGTETRSRGRPPSPPSTHPHQGPLPCALLSCAPCSHLFSDSLCKVRTVTVRPVPEEAATCCCCPGEAGGCQLPCLCLNSCFEGRTIPFSPLSCLSLLAWICLSLPLSTPTSSAPLLAAWVRLTICGQPAALSLYGLQVGHGSQPPKPQAPWASPAGEQLNDLVSSNYTLGPTLNNQYSPVSVPSLKMSRRYKLL